MSKTSTVVVLQCPACNAAIGDNNYCDYCKHRLLIDGDNVTVDLQDGKPAHGRWFTNHIGPDWDLQEHGVSEFFSSQVAKLIEFFFLEQAENNPLKAVTQNSWVEMRLPGKITTLREGAEVADRYYERLFVLVENAEFSFENAKVMLQLNYRLAKHSRTGPNTSWSFGAVVPTPHFPRNFTHLEDVSRGTLDVKFPGDFPDSAPLITLKDPAKKEKIQWYFSKTNDEWLQTATKWNPTTDDLVTCLRKTFIWLSWFDVDFD